MFIVFVYAEYEQYPQEGYEAEYNFDPETVKYEGDQSHFQAEEY